ncbi:MAG: hypothetical protein KJ592_02935 [Nanoarchaeota archaeon]|nr:hypothetical protein [Nanoarchaeota archaeon]
MKIIKKFVNKCLSLLRLGHEWLNKLTTSLIEAARTNSYIETVSPTQADTIHKEIKNLDIKFLMKEYEMFVRQSLKELKLENKHVKIGVDVTEDNTWLIHGIRNTRPSTHKGNHHVNTFQYLNIAITEPFFFPLMSVPYTSLNNLTSLTIDLLKYLKTLPLKVDMVLFDRGFYIAHLIDYMENRRGGNPIPYLMFVKKTEPVKDYIEQTEIFDVFCHTFDYCKDKSGWHPSCNIVIWKPDPKVYPDVAWPFATNLSPEQKTIDAYPKRWPHETGFRVADEAQIKSKSSYLIIRFFYHLLGMVMVILWRVQSENNNHVVFKTFLKAVEAKYAKLIVYPVPPPDIAVY